MIQLSTNKVHEHQIRQSYHDQSVSVGVSTIFIVLKPLLASAEVIGIVRTAIVRPIA